MTTQTEALKLALEELAVRFSEGWHEGIKIDASDIMLLNEAAQTLAQPEQEPWGACLSGRVFVGKLPEHVRKLVEDDGLTIQWLYTTPPQHSAIARKPLTDDWIRSMCKQDWVFETVKQWVRIAEKAHGIGENK